MPRPARPGCRTSGICQPPVHAIALRHLLDRGRERGGADRGVAEAFVGESFDAVAGLAPVARHGPRPRRRRAGRDPPRLGVRVRRLARAGTPPTRGSPPARVPPFVRRDPTHVASPPSGPPTRSTPATCGCIEQKAVGYDDARVRSTDRLPVRDVFFSAVLAAASRGCSPRIGEELAARGDAATELRRAIAARFRAGVASTVDPATGLARDLDLRTGEWLGPLTVAGFAPLVRRWATRTLTRASATCCVGRAAGWATPALRYPLPPSTSPGEPGLPRRAPYWRGPVWPFLNLLLGWACARDGATELRGRAADGLAGAAHPT